MRSAWPLWAWFFFATLLGVSGTAYLLGWRSLDVTDVGWLAGDPQTAYLGWDFFRQEEGWHWPLTWSSQVNYPLGVSTAYFDSTPILALFFKPLSAVLPNPFQYGGWLVAGNAALQAFVGFLLARRVFGEQPVLVLLAGLLFFFAPVFLWRVQGHFSLTAHWLLLASFLLYLAPAKELVTRGRLLIWVLLLWTASGIQPYLSVMVILISFATLGKLKSHGLCRGRKALFVCGAILGVTALSLTFHGFLFANDLSANAGGGLGSFSMNLLSLFDAGAVGSPLLPSLPRFVEEQYEGYGYLGAGVLLLLFVAALAARRLLHPEDRRRWLPLLIMCLVAIIIALSPRITLGGWQLASFGDALPSWMLNAWASFRSTGRFVWLPHYAILIGTLVVLSRLSRRRLCQGVLALAVVLQAYDLGPLQATVRNTWHEAEARPLQDAVWKQIGQSYRHLVVLPAWQCNWLETPLGKEGFWYFGRLALDQKMTINSFYVSRYSHTTSRASCDLLPRRLIEQGMDEDTAYVLSPAFARSLVVRGATDDCQALDGVVLCALGLKDRAPLEGWVSLLSVYRLGDAITFDRSAKSQAFLASGWALRLNDKDPLYSVGSAARLAFRLEERPTTDLSLTLRFMRFVTPGDEDFLLVVKVNGTNVGALRLTKDDMTQPRELKVPLSLVGPDGALEIVLQTEFPQGSAATPQGAWPQHSLFLEGFSLTAAAP